MGHGPSTDRRGALRTMAGTVLAISLPTLSACGERDGLKFANWENYLGETTLPDFKDATGIDITLEAIASEQALFDQLSKGQGQPDLIMASNLMVERLVAADLLQPISKARIPNLRNLDPRFVDAPYDPGRKYSMPYAWQAYGIGYRRSKVSKPPSSWHDLLTNPVFAGRFSLPRDPVELLRIVARANGKAPGLLKETDVPALAEQLKAALPAIKGFHGQDGQDQLLSKQVDLVADYTGDIAQVMLEDADIGFVHPLEGADLTCDNLCLPKAGKRAENAHKFIDYLLGGQAGSRVVETILFPTPNLAAKALMADQYRTSTVLFPPAEVFAKLEYARWNPALDDVLVAAAKQAGVPQA